MLKATFLQQLGVVAALLAYFIPLSHSLSPNVISETPFLRPDSNVGGADRLRLAVAQTRLLSQAGSEAERVQADRELAAELCSCGRFGDEYRVADKWRQIERLSSTRDPSRWGEDCGWLRNFPLCSTSRSGRNAAGYSIMSLRSKDSEGLTPPTALPTCFDPSQHAASTAVFEKGRSDLGAIRQFLAGVVLRNLGISPEPAQLELWRMSSGEEGFSVVHKWEAGAFRIDDNLFFSKALLSVEDLVQSGDWTEKDVDEVRSQLKTKEGMDADVRKALISPSFSLAACKSRRLWWALKEQALPIAMDLKGFFSLLNDSVAQVWKEKVGSIPSRRRRGSDAESQREGEGEDITSPPAGAVRVASRIRSLLSSALTSFLAMIAGSHSAGVFHRDIISSNLVFLSSLPTGEAVDWAGLVHACLTEEDEAKEGVVCSVPIPLLKIVDWDHAKVEALADEKGGTGREWTVLQPLLSYIADTTLVELGMGGRDGHNMDDIYALAMAFSIHLTEVAASHTPTGQVFPFRYLLRRYLSLLSFPLASSRPSHSDLFTFTQKAEGGKSVELTPLLQKYAQAGKEEEIDSFLEVVYPSFFATRAKITGKPAICSAPNLRVHSPPTADVLVQHPSQLTGTGRPVKRNLVIRYSGYQNFDVVASAGRVPFAVRPHDGDSTLAAKEKALLLAADMANRVGVPLFDNASVVDIGGNHGFVLYHSLLKGASKGMNIELDQEYIDVGMKVAPLFGGSRTTKTPFFFEGTLEEAVEIGMEADTVAAFAIVHWIVGCTEGDGTLKTALNRLLGIAKRALIIEWVDERDSMIVNYGHIPPSSIESGDYTTANFERILTASCSHLMKVLSSRQTRHVYLCLR
uniref:Protein kinase domain-containing protein n=1 Tax=Palpitomonas bilix TaxID=652834 RepID=A0A7S3G7T9_9EUKA|mmetsp:Transcript_28829/g.73879  ORF Transcript_28829/g.73879 Transcript_28829/m.73879 type:complete len:859 (+) Transcript_28829:116-2692(+)